MNYTTKVILCVLFFGFMSGFIVAVANPPLWACFLVAVVVGATGGIVANKIPRN